jgi:hypothetical protein
MEIISPDVGKVFNNLVDFFKIFSFRYEPSTDLHLIFSDIPYPFHNICIVGDSASLQPAALDKIIQQFAATNIASFCLFIQGATVSTQLDDLLQSKKFEKSSTFAGLLKELSDDTYPIELPANTKIVMVEAMDQLEDWVIPFKTGFDHGDKSAAKVIEHFKKLFTNKNIKHFILYHHAQPIGCASLFITDEIAGFYNLAVDVKYQNSGLGLMLQKTRLNVAREIKCTVATMEAAAISEHMAYKLGFEKVTNFIPYLYHFNA